MNTLPKQRAQELLAAFPSLRVGVVGDAMLDTFTYGRIERMSPEAPVPVVLVERDEYMPGGAANVAANISSLGAQVTLSGRRADDAAGRHLSELLKEKGIDDKLLVSDSGGGTIEKCRIIAGDAHVVRIDREDIRALPKAEEEKLLSCILSEMREWHAVILTDYAKGLFSENIARTLVAAAQAQGIPVIVDTKPKNADFFTGATLLKPNLEEAIAMTGIEDPKEAGPVLVEKNKSAVLLTCGAEGMYLFDGHEEAYFPARTQEALDVAGAGDTVVATCALALAAGASLPEAAHLANEAAGISVKKPGTSVVRSEECIDCFA